MKITKLTSWMGPAFLGTMLSSWASVSLYVLLGRPDPVLGQPWLTWLLAVAVATPVAFSLATTMMIVDVLLLKLKVRALPTGGSAWGMAMLSPLPVVASYLVFRPSFAFWPWGFAAALVLPVVVSSLTIRLVLGRKLDAV